MEENKDLQDFKRKLIKIDFPFKELFNDNEERENILFKEFIKTEKIPDESLFLCQFYNEEEYAKGIYDGDKQIFSRNNSSISVANLVPQTSFEEHINQIFRDFYELVATKKLDKSFYSYDLEQVETIKKLRNINATIERIKTKVIYENITDIKFVLEGICTKIYDEIQELNNESLKSDVLEKIIKNDENVEIDIQVFCRNIPDDESRTIRERWDLVKDLINSTLKGYTKNEVSKPTTAPELIKLNYGENNDKIIQLLHAELNGTFIENIDFKDFERHFKDNGAELKRMQWTGKQPQIVHLIHELNKINSQQYILIVNHFYDQRNDKDFSNTQLGAVYQKLKKEKQKEVNIVLVKINILVNTNLL